MNAAPDAAEKVGVVEYGLLSWVGWGAGAAGDGVTAAGGAGAAVACGVVP